MSEQAEARRFLSSEDDHVNAGAAWRLSFYARTKKEPLSRQDEHRLLVRPFHNTCLLQYRGTTKLGVALSFLFLASPRSRQDFDQTCTRIRGRRHRLELR